MYSSPCTSPSIPASGTGDVTASGGGGKGTDAWELNLVVDRGVTVRGKTLKNTESEYNTIITVVNEKRQVVTEFVMKNR